MKKILHFLLVFIFLICGIFYVKPAPGNFKLNFKNNIVGHKIKKITFYYYTDQNSLVKIKTLTANDLNCYQAPNDSEGLLPTRQIEVFLNGVLNTEEVFIRVITITLPESIYLEQTNFIIEWPANNRFKEISSGDIIIIERYAVNYGVYKYRVRIGDWLSAE